ncbi:hypothetical protein [Pseudoduganella namucuonensis]|uniref:hypothetical protein n=1 Tax=Pseudoduganella namucuonensis TaxID=1035707 RepID=UPI0015A5DB98|nr:hypothetical protein [Pseudoduganella namucuonensis]
MEQQERERRRPSKEQIRSYLATRRAQRSPPPSIGEIRRQLGWGLLPRLNGEAGAAT